MSKRLDVAHNTALLRVDFDDDSIWRRVRDAVLAPLTPGDVSNLIVIEDKEFEGVDLARLETAPEGYEKRVLIVFDRQSREHATHPLLLIDWFAEVDEDDDERFMPGAIRIAPEHVPEAEINLSLANMDLDDYVAHADQEGIFRGFRKS